MNSRLIWGNAMTEIIKMDDMTWRIEDDFVRFFLLVGKEKAILLDSGVNTPNAKEIAEGLTDLPIMLFNTHGDGDHTSGTAAFEEIHIHPADYINCEVDKRYPSTALVAVHDGDVFDLGERTIKAVAIPGHTMGSIAYLDVDRRQIFAGDSVQTTHIYMFGNKRAPEQFIDSLDKLISISDSYDRIVASHGEAILPANYVERIKENWNEVLEGRLSCEEVNLFGNKVKSYTAKYCGFFVQ